jgi:predicted enzyme related to lactoylglutathione lyase
MSVVGTVIRQRVDDLDTAAAFYEQLTGQTANRFSYGGVDLAAVGPFLLFSCDDGVAERLSRVVATIVVDDLQAQARILTDLGAIIVAPPAPTPNGHRLIAKHPDGGVFEYTGP